ncbi:hypothetical protein N7G274_008001 [Stereocaulon virgatum]|uniref:Uncharacterized protein n=1 Tax=Stereocaulon virgatum TaxID=373712 RepID=A0ABR4A2S7_9LECA
MRTRSATQPEELEILTDHGGSRKRHASTKDASPIVQPPAPKRRKQADMKMSIEKEDGLERLAAKHNFKLHAHLPSGEQAARTRKKRKMKFVRFDDGAFTINEKLEKEMERSMGELDGVLPGDLFEEADLAIIDMAREKNGEENNCSNGHGTETADQAEEHPNLVVERSPDSIVVTQTDVLQTKANPSTNFTSQSEIGSEAVEINKRYGALKVEAWRWALKHFPSADSAKASLSLLKLAETSPELIEYVDYISACTDHDWLYVFNEQRPKLVFGILGKMLEVHVFGHEMFGATDEQLHKLQEEDFDKRNADAFRRHTARLTTLSKVIFSSSSTPQNIITSLSNLQASFLLLLGPLLPTPQNPPTTLSPSLSHILHAAAHLSLLTRHQTQPSTLYHFSPHPPIGSPFCPKTMHALNPASVKQQNITRRATDTLVVTMTGWPSLTAYTSTSPPFPSSPTPRNQPLARHLIETPLSKSEVALSYGTCIKPLSIETSNWLGRSLRDELDLLERTRDWESRQWGERRALLAAGACVGIGVGGLWVWGRW